MRGHRLGTDQAGAVLFPGGFFRRPGGRDLGHRRGLLLRFVSITRVAREYQAQFGFDARSDEELGIALGGW
jgi:hypothetical protein